MTGHRDARRFGLSVGGVLALGALLAAWRGRPGVAAVVGLGALGLLGGAALAPRLLATPSRHWMRVAHALAWLNTRVLLALFFALVITPVGVALRIGGWDPLARRRRGARTGWVPCRPRDARHYERMY